MTTLLLEHILDKDLQHDSPDKVQLSTYQVDDQLVVSSYRAGTTTLNSYYNRQVMTIDQILDKGCNVLLICRDPVDRWNSAFALMADHVIGNPNSDLMINLRHHFIPYIKYFVGEPKVKTYKWDVFCSEHEDRTFEDDPRGLKRAAKKLGNFSVVPYPEIWDEEIWAYKFMMEENMEGRINVDYYEEIDDYRRTVEE